MMMAFAWTVGTGDEWNGRRKELACLLQHKDLSLIFLIFCETYVGLAQDFRHWDAGMGWNSPYEDRTGTEVKISMPLKVSGQNLGSNSPFEEPRRWTCSSSAELVKSLLKLTWLACTHRAQVVLWPLRAPRAHGLGWAGLGEITAKLKGIYSPVLQGDLSSLYSVKDNVPYWTHQGV